MPPRFGPCDICGGSRTVSLPVKGMGTAADFSPAVMTADEPSLMADTGERRRYPCPECVKPPKYEGRDSRNGYSLIRANKLVNEKLAKNYDYMESMRGNVCALIGRTLYAKGLVPLTQYRAPPGPSGLDNVVIEGIAEVRWPDGFETDNVIQDLDPDIYGERMYRPEPKRQPLRPPDRDGPDIRMMIGSQPEPLTATKARSRKRTPTPRELIFDDPVPDEED